MARMNAEVEIGGRDFAGVARDFVTGRPAGGGTAEASSRSFTAVLFGPDVTAGDGG